MKTLHLGVIDLPYSDTPGVTTGDVAKILEAKYGVMAAFYRRHKTEIQQAIKASLQGQMRSVMVGKPLNSDPFARACSQIDDMFKEFLSASKIEGMGIKGVPTKAALDGVSHRFKKGKNKGKKRRGNGVRRPSFIDTDTYQAAEKSWVD